jgi:predicted RNA-binding Zn ribbon-like protein
MVSAERSLTRPAPFLLADHPALDFLNTLASPSGTPIEWLEEGADLLSWLEAAGRVEPAEARRLRRRWGQGVLDRATKEARVLREWFRGVVSRRAAKGAAGVGAGDVARLNTLLARDASYPLIDRVRGRWSLRSARRLRDPRDLLAVVAESMAALLCEGDFAMVRRCDHPACTLWFYDRTKGHARRWCSMAVCGNRAKAALHRRRARRG